MIQELLEKNKPRLQILTALLCVFAINGAYADCVYGAKSKNKFVVLDSHTVILKGGFGKDILIKTFAFIYSSSSLTILKDDFPQRGLILGVVVVVD